MKPLVVVLCLLVFSSVLYAQDEENYYDYSRNTFYGSLSHGGTSVGLMLSYERLLFKPGRKMLSSLWLNGKAGVRWEWDSFGPAFSVMANGLMFNGNHHLDYGLGVHHFFDYTGYRIDKDDGHSAGLKAYGVTGIAFALGYRYQRATKGSVFRFGFGYPQIVYLSYGFTF